MFENVGGKLKGFARGLFVIAIISGVCTAISFLVLGFSLEEGLFVLLSVPAGIVEVLVFLLPVWLIHGFGTVVSNHEREEAQASETFSSATKRETVFSHHPSLHEEVLWVCDNCGEKSTDMFCGQCGKKRPLESTNKPASKENPMVAGVWRCPKCGKTNMNESSCWSCGTEKPQ